MADQFKFKDGFLIPDVEVIRAQITALKEKLIAHPGLLEEYKKDPRVVLGAHGISTPVQDEILAEDTSYHQARPEGCGFTCHATRCAVMSITQ